MPIPRTRKNSATSSSDNNAVESISLIQFVRQETEEHFVGLFVIGSISGISSAILLALINIGAATADL